MTPEQSSALRRLDKQFDAIRSMPVPIPRAERYRSSIEQVGARGYIRVVGQLCQVLDVHRYREKKWEWYEIELFNIESGDTLYLEWEKDDELEVSLNQPPITLRDIGATADEIEEMSDEEEGTIRYDGKSYEYEDDYGAVFYRGGAGEGEPVYVYDFETSDERWCLTVEEWGDERDGYEYEVYVSEYLEPETIEVLVVGEPREG